MTMLLSKRQAPSAFQTSPRCDSCCKRRFWNTFCEVRFAWTEILPGKLVCWLDHKLKNRNDEQKKARGEPNAMNSAGLHVCPRLFKKKSAELQSHQSSDLSQTFMDHTNAQWSTTQIKLCTSISETHIVAAALTVTHLHVVKFFRPEQKCIFKSC